VLHSRRVHTLGVRLPRTSIRVRNERTRISAKRLSSVGYSFLSISLTSLANALLYRTFPLAFRSRHPIPIPIRNDVITQRVSRHARSLVNFEILNSDWRIPSEPDALGGASPIDSRARVAAAREIKIYDRPRDRVARAFSVALEKSYTFVGP